MGQLLVFDRILKRSSDMRLANNRIKCLRPVFSCGNDEFVHKPEVGGQKSEVGNHKPESLFTFAIIKKLSATGMTGFAHQNQESRLMTKDYRHTTNGVSGVGETLLFCQTNSGR